MHVNLNLIFFKDNILISMPKVELKEKKNEVVVKAEPLASKKKKIEINHK